MNAESDGVNIKRLKCQNPRKFFFEILSTAILLGKKDSNPKLLAPLERKFYDLSNDTPHESIAFWARMPEPKVEADVKILAAKIGRVSANLGKPYPVVSNKHFQWL